MPTLNRVTLKPEQRSCEPAVKRGTDPQVHSPSQRKNRKSVDKAKRNHILYKHTALLESALMKLNLGDPASIVAWWKILPERHGPQLEAFERLRPQFAPPIRAAWRIIKADPKLRPAFEQSRALATEVLVTAPYRHYKDDPADALLAA
ncbi:hypothetical protein [Paucibacter sp. Y2R2-4]|uniref:hypothetical protein n=1 Tax=Paucibacter sp. Y2R2-4 TaxID=2893553 RepID=UPI0021E376DA|nr:hypothetical protein [Paucibacter sp. Y2R2-4]MCV2350314.1 hypothetical protein [Paucibacter sp. Y2R2-4]